MHGMSRFVPAALLACGVAGSSCARSTPARGAALELTRVPIASEGGPDVMAPIAGSARGARPGQRIVLYAHSGPWWVQPLADQPFTAIRADGTFENTTHLGTEYAALLVEPDFKPPARTDQLPATGGVAAVAIRKGALPADPRPAKTLQFAGYEWHVRDVPSDRGGWNNPYDPANAWTDADGALHLRIAAGADGWTCAEVVLARSFGYGTYRFVVRDVSRLHPQVVAAFFTWDDAASDARYREMGIEIGRWGDPATANMQYVIQPYYVPANVSRFEGAGGTLTHTLRWELGRASFATRAHGRPAPLADHVFTSGVPMSGNENVRIALYVFGNPPAALPPTEVVVESFEFVP